MYPATAAPTSSSTGSPPATRSRTSEDETANGSHLQEATPIAVVVSSALAVALVALAAARAAATALSTSSRPAPSRSATARRRQLQQLSRFAPARQRARRVGSHDERQLCVRVARMHGPQGIHRIRMAPRAPPRAHTSPAPRRPPPPGDTCAGDAPGPDPRRRAYAARRARASAPPAQRQAHAAAHARERNVSDVGRVERPTENADATRHNQPRTCPSPSTRYLNVHSSRNPIGPRACSFCVELPISAPIPNSPPSVKRVEAFTYTHAASTPS